MKNDVYEKIMGIYIYTEREREREGTNIEGSVMGVRKRERENCNEFLFNERIIEEGSVLKR